MAINSPPPIYETLTLTFCQGYIKLLVGKKFERVGEVAFEIDTRLKVITEKIVTRKVNFMIFLK
ncbi:MAG: hypothetical protein LBD88_03005 [Candidatus Peribacteria bacterium]|jgi:hypothetical protein|nr:hypothetical protein [Candidatus Peribacteria bacterium]